MSRLVSPCIAIMIFIGSTSAESPRKTTFNQESAVHKSIRKSTTQVNISKRGRPKAQLGGVVSSKSAAPFGSPVQNLQLPLPRATGMLLAMFTMFTILGGRHLFARRH